MKNFFFLIRDYLRKGYIWCGVTYHSIPTIFGTPFLLRIPHKIPSKMGQKVVKISTSKRGVVIIVKSFRL